MVRLFCTVYLYIPESQLAKYAPPQNRIIWYLPPSKIEWDLTNGPLNKLLELLDTQVEGSVQWVRLEISWIAWLFQLDDSKPLHQKMVVHFKLVGFRVPGWKYFPKSMPSFENHFRKEWKCNSPVKMNGWKMYFILKWSLFRGRIRKFSGV